MSDWEEKIALVRAHYEGIGYRVHSGLQFGCELVLYADDPQHVHSDFCIHVVRDGKFFSFFSFSFVVSFWLHIRGGEVPVWSKITTKEKYILISPPPPWLSKTQTLVLFLFFSLTDDLLDWREIQTLVRSMPDLHKTLILAHVKYDKEGKIHIQEIAVASEHAPFRHRIKFQEVGSQRKKQKTT